MYIVIQEFHENKLYKIGDLYNVKENIESHLSLGLIKKQEIISEPEIELEQGKKNKRKK